MSKVFDLFIIGGGINGAGIARDAAGRGLSVCLADKGEIGGATSSWSTKLIHGGLRYLENYEFKLVRESLIEREIVYKIAKPISKPIPFIIPYVDKIRPAWLIKIGLFLSKIFIRLTATVTISAPDSFIALAVSLKFLYLPVPTINRDFNFILAIFRLSFFKLSSTNKMYYFNFIIIF